jgi:thiosulfate reductase cytochrome b subunit
MQPGRIRTIVRWIHLSAAAIIGTSVYSPWSSDPVFASVLKFAVFPLLGLTGLVLWQQARLRRLGDASRSTPGGKRP